MFTDIIYSFSLFLYVAALAVHKRDVFSPEITYPTASTIWNVGEVHNVKWSIANAPPGFPINNATGTILLGFLENDSENLDIDHPLADKFLLKDTQVQITVPKVKSRDDYIIVLLGDSGNASPEFTIHNITISSPPPPSSSSSSTVPSSTTSASKPSSPTQSQTSSSETGTQQQQQQPTGTADGTTSQSASAPASSATAPLPSSESTSGPVVTTLIVPGSSSSSTSAPTGGAFGTGSASSLVSHLRLVDMFGPLGVVVYFLL